jgi:hypothetical protein
MQKEIIMSSRNREMPHGYREIPHGREMPHGYREIPHG